MKLTKISSVKFSTIRLVGEQRANLKVQIDRLKSILEELPTAADLAREHSIPVNTVRQILAGNGYGGRPMTRSVTATEQVIA